MNRSRIVQVELLAMQNAATRYEQALADNALQFIKRHYSGKLEDLPSTHVSEVTYGISKFSQLLRKDMPLINRRSGIGNVSVQFDLADPEVICGRLAWEGSSSSRDLGALLDASLGKVTSCPPMYDIRRHFANDLVYAQVSIPEFEIKPASRGIAVWTWKRHELEASDEDWKYAQIERGKLKE